MFPKPQQLIGLSYPVESASRDPRKTGKKMAARSCRNYIFFTILAIAAAADLYLPGLGSPTYYLVVSVFSLVPLLATVF